MFPIHYSNPNRYPTNPSHIVLSRIIVAETAESSVPFETRIRSLESSAYHMPRTESSARTDVPRLPNKLLRVKQIIRQTVQLGRQRLGYAILPTMALPATSSLSIAGNPTTVEDINLLTTHIREPYDSIITKTRAMGRINNVKELRPIAAVLCAELFGSINTQDHDARPGPDQVQEAEAPILRRTQHREDLRAESVSLELNLVSERTLLEAQSQSSPVDHLSSSSACYQSIEGGTRHESGRPYIATTSSNGNNIQRQDYRKQGLPQFPETTIQSDQLNCCEMTAASSAWQPSEIYYSLPSEDLPINLDLLSGQSTGSRFPNEAFSPSHPLSIVGPQGEDINADAVTPYPEAAARSRFITNLSSSAAGFTTNVFDDQRLGTGINPSESSSGSNLNHIIRQGQPAQPSATSRRTPLDEGTEALPYILSASENSHDGEEEGDGESIPAVEEEVQARCLAIGDWLSQLEEDGFGVVAGRRGGWSIDDDGEEAVPMLRLREFEPFECVF